MDVKQTNNGRTRLLTVTAGNVRHSHIYVSGHRDFFPRDAVGGPNRHGRSATGIEIELDGLDERVTTDIGSDAKTGKPRGYLRGRAWVRRFYQHHGIQPGDVLSLERQWLTTRMRMSFAIS